MSAKVYLLLNLVNGQAEQVVQSLQLRPGVVMADRLEGNPDAIVAVEAPDRQRLAELIMPIISSIEDITEDLHLLVTPELAVNRA